MVAVAVLAVAATAIYFSNTEALSSQRKLEEQTIAHWILANEVAMVKLGARVKAVDQSGRLAAGTASRRMEYAGYEWDLVMRTERLSGSARSYQWDLFRIVDGESLGPIRSASSVIWTSP